MKTLKFKRLITTALTVAFLANSMNVVALGLSRTSSNDYSKLVQDFTDGQNAGLKKGNSRINRDIDTTTNDLVSIIVEFVSDPLVDSQPSTYFNGESKVDRDHRLFEKFLSNLPSTFSNEEAPTITHSYKTVFNGVALTIEGSKIEALLDSGVVKKIHNDTKVTIEPPADLDFDSQGAENEISPFMMDSLPALGVDELHKEKITGEGIKVGVLDTGIDYNHPDLTNAYKGFRSEDGDSKNQDINTIKGWDFVDNDADPMETTYDDWQESGLPEFNGPNSYYTAHGTHVSGTIAGTSDNTDNDYAVLGVAPNVDLYGYRVLGKYGSGATSGIIAAIEKSVTDGMDVINMSLGSDGSNGPYDPMVEAVNNATKAGVVTVIANGNAGPNPFTVGVPGTAQLPIAVGASNVEMNIKTYNLAIGDLSINSALVSPSFDTNITDLLNKDLDIVYCGLGDKKDFEGKDLTGKIAFVDRGIITFAEKATNAYNAGAKVLILANNVNDADNPIPFIGESAFSNILSISMESGQALKEVLDNTVTLSETESITAPGDEVTGFSSVGPVRQTYEIRPDIVAPGFNVFSTVPEYYTNKNATPDDYSNAYQRMSGTSMAAPHIAGIAALILQKNPDYTPEQVKLALMNTSEEISKLDGSDYSVHQAGAGRVNAYESVHEEVTFSANYKVTAGPNHDPLENTTGMLSFGKAIDDKETPISKTIPVTVTNNSSSEKSYNIVVDFLNSYISNDATSNNVALNLPEIVTIAPGSSETFNVELTAPNNLKHGHYEGYIHFTEVNDNSNTYQMPFSMSILKDGFGSLNYPELSPGFGRGMTAVTSSDIFMRHPVTYFGLGDISIILSVNEELQSVSTYVVDPSTKERIGFAGKEDLSWLPSGMEGLVENIAPHGRVKKIVNGKVSHEEFPLPSGSYLLEVVGLGLDGTEFSEYLPMAIINDTSKDTITYDMGLGIIEATDDLYTEEVWYDDQSHEGLWIKANVFNEIVNELKTEHGLDYIEQSHLNNVFAFGYYRNGHSTPMENMLFPNGDITLAGVEKSDLSDGLFRVELNYANAGRVMNKPEAITFVQPGSSYLEMISSQDTIRKNDKFNTTIKIHNAKNVIKGDFKLQNLGDAMYDNLKITPSKELKALCGDNNINASINYEKVEDPWFQYDAFNVSFEITSDDPNFAGIEGDMNLFDLEFEVVGFEGIGEDLVQNNTFIYDQFTGVDGDFFNRNNELVDVMAGSMFKTLNLEYTDRTLIYGQTTSPWGGMREASVHAIDPEGNKYEPDFFAIDEWLGRNHIFTFNNLPVIDGDYKVIIETPGCFDSIINVPGSKLNENNERVGNSYGLISVSMAPSIYSYPGDVNGDGAIDIVDAAAVAEEYVPGEEHMFSLNPSSENTLTTDITQDGVVNYYDMYLLLTNYLMQDLTREDSKVPAEYLDGRDIIDILESCGYYDEVPERDIKLNINTEKSLVGDTINLDVTQPPQSEGVPFEYEFAVRERNDKDWTVIGERSEAKNISWISNSAGEYEFRARIFLDEIEYVWQDNATHTVEWAITESVSILNDNLIDGILNMNTGTTNKLEATINPWNAKPQQFIWNSSDKSVVTVDSEGNLSAVKEGTATITATTCDKQFSASITVNVSDIALESIELNKTSMDIKIGQSDKLEVIFKPENATNKNITWTSSDDKVATVIDGTVVGLKAGTTTVTATSEDGKFTASCEVKVSKVDVHVESIELDKENLALTVGDSETLTATVKPENADNKNVIWTSADNKVATVENGKVVAVGSGTTTITVTSEDGKLTDTCDVKVTDKEVPPTKPEATKIKLDKNSAKLNVGDKLTLKATVSPDDAEMPTLVWSSSDEKVATVKDGVVTALKAGKVKITVTSKDGKLSDTCNITVSKKDGKPELPQTGALVGSSLLAVVGLCVLGIGAFVILKKKKEENNK